MKCNYCGADFLYDVPYCCYCGSPQRSSPTLEEIYVEWKGIHYRHKSTKTILGYECAWKRLSVYKNRPINSIEFLEYQVLMDSIKDQSRSSQCKLRGLINQLTNYAITIKGVLLRNYTPYLVLDGYKPEGREIFTDEEISRLYLYAQANQEYSRDAMITLTLIFTGLRPSELFAIQKDNINLSGMYMVAPGSKTAAGRNRLIPFIPQIQKFIYYFYFENRSCPYLIASPNGCQTRLEHWRFRYFYPLLRELGICTPDNLHRLSPHCCRHTYASLAKRSGVDEGILIKMIGHVSFSTTEQIYIHEQLPEYQAEMKKLGMLAEKISYGKEGSSCATK